MNDTMIDASTFRSLLGRFATGVTVVTTRDSEGHDHGMTVSAFSSVSLDPPLVLVCLAHDCTVLAVLPEGASFAVNVLAETQEALSRRFASELHDRFDGVGYSRSVTGAPLLDDALVHLECRVHALHEAGDHSIVVGRVDAGVARETAGPLLYYRSGYASLVR